MAIFMNDEQAEKFFNYAKETLADSDMYKEVIGHLEDEYDAESCDGDIASFLADRMNLEGGGFGAYIYYSDTDKFLVDHLSEIQDLLADAIEQGYVNVEYLRSNRSFLCWFAVGSILDEVFNLLEEYDEEDIEEDLD